MRLVSLHWTAAVALDLRAGERRPMQCAVRSTRISEFSSIIESLPTKKVTHVDRKTVGPWVGVSIGLALFVALLAAKPGGKPFPPEQAAAVVQGLQLVVSATHQGKPGKPELQVEFRNVGEYDMSLNLGMMLGNGRSQYPTNVLLSLTDAEGKKRELKFKEPRVAGRVDDYVVPLRMGSTYSLKLNVNQFWVPQSKEFDVKLNPGRNQITAYFEGTEADHTEGLKLVHMGIWKGKIESNALSIDGE